MTSGQIDAFLTFLRNSEQQYRMAEADELETNGETQDILHSLELEEHDYRDFARLSKELRTVRQRRRQAKDTQAVLAPVVAWMDENRTVVKGLENLLGAVRRAEKNTANRIYTPRTRRQ